MRLDTLDLSMSLYEYALVLMRLDTLDALVFKRLDALDLSMGLYEYVLVR